MTGVYEYGAEYVNKNSLVKTSHGSGLNIHSFDRAASTKARNHYLTLYTTLNNRTGFKMYAGYSGTLSKNSVDTAFTIKGEYRW